MRPSIAAIALCLAALASPAAAQNAPTGPDYKIADEPDLDKTRERLTQLIAKFHDSGEPGLDGNVHPFFGPLTGKQWGETQYKHLDHHFRQFGV